jgi:hypothetical protein
MAYENQNNPYDQQKAYAVQAQAAMGQINGGAGSVPKQPIAERAIQELAARLESISHLAMRVARVADRIHGPELQNPTGSDKQSQPQALTDKFSLLYQAAAEIEMSLRNQVERLENFV